VPHGQSTAALVQISDGKIQKGKAGAQTCADAKGLAQKIFRFSFVVSLVVW